ncbi:hypothetical protein THAOC_04523, partial [Thalassiosira oceanica]
LPPASKYPQANPDYVLGQDGALGPAIVFDTLNTERQNVDQFAHGIRRHPHLGVESIFVDELLRMQSVGILPWMHPSLSSTVEHGVLSERHQFLKRLEVLLPSLAMLPALETKRATSGWSGGVNEASSEKPLAETKKLAEIGSSLLATANK